MKADTKYTTNDTPLNTHDIQHWEEMWRSGEQVSGRLKYLKKWMIEKIIDVYGNKRVKENEFREVIKYAWNKESKYMMNTYDTNGKRNQEDIYRVVSDRIEVLPNEQDSKVNNLEENNWKVVPK